MTLFPKIFGSKKPKSVDSDKASNEQSTQFCKFFELDLSLILSRFGCVTAVITVRLCLTYAHGHRPLTQSDSSVENRF